MINLQNMFPAVANSPRTYLSTGITATDTIIHVEDAAALQITAPNLLVIGGNQPNAETVQVISIADNALTIERAFEGESQAWDANSPIARNHTAYDHNTNIQNIDTLLGAIVDTEVRLQNNLNTFAARRDNPNQVTAKQTGAVPESSRNQPNGFVGKDENGDTQVEHLNAQSVNVSGQVTLIGTPTAPDHAARLQEIEAAKAAMASGMVGSWNPVTNIPAMPITPTSDHDGRYWLVSVDGSRFGIDFLEGNFLAVSDGVWDTIQNAGRVASVNNQTGAVVVTPASIGAAPANVTLADNTGANTLPPTTSTTIEIALQTVRNGLRWLFEQFNTLGHALRAVTADTLTTARNINGVSFDGSEDITIPVGALPDSNAALGFGRGINTQTATTAARTVAISGFVLRDQAIVRVRFNNGLNTANAQLNVAGSGNIPIHTNGAVQTAAINLRNCPAGYTADFQYSQERNAWDFINPFGGGRTLPPDLGGTGRSGQIAGNMNYATSATATGVIAPPTANVPQILAHTGAISALPFWMNISDLPSGGGGGDIEITTAYGTINPNVIQHINGDDFSAWSTKCKLTRVGNSFVIVEIYLGFDFVTEIHSWDALFFLPAGFGGSGEIFIGASDGGGFEFDMIAIGGESINVVGMAVPVPTGTVFVANGVYTLN